MRLFLLSLVVERTTDPVYSTVGVGDYAIVVANRWGSSRIAPRTSPLASIGGYKSSCTISVAKVLQCGKIVRWVQRIGYVSVL